MTLVTGLPALLKTLRETREQGLSACSDAVTVQANQVRIDSMLATPVDTGALCDSHFVTPIVGINGRFYTGVEAGGWLAPYAIRVHEDLNMRHPRGGEAKFMERAIIRGQRRLAQIFEARVSGRLAL